MDAEQSQLSAREKEVIDLLLQGKSNKEIALALGVSVSTVEFHLKNVYRKLGVKSRTEAILQLGLTTGGQDGKPRDSIVDGTEPNAENGGNSIPQQEISMKQRFYIVGGTIAVFLILVAIVLGRSLLSRGASPSAADAAASPLTTAMGTSFVFPPGLGEGATGELVPQSTGYSVWPQHIKISLAGYPLQESAYTPQILVFPADVYRHVDPCAEAQIQGLETILKSGTVALPEPLPCTFNPDTLPLLPDQKAAQVFHAAEKILPFQNGTGIRYITQYSQAAFPAVENQYLFYTFQGLTSDGQYYVSVVLPVHLPALDGMPTPASAEEAASSVQTARDLLNQQSASLQPSLESLDALVQSISAGIQP